MKPNTQTQPQQQEQKQVSKGLDIHFKLIVMDRVRPTMQLRLLPYGVMIIRANCWAQLANR